MKGFFYSKKIDLLEFLTSSLFLQGLKLKIDHCSMEEHYFQCPYCWEDISMLLDTSVTNQTYIEDCEVCCNPIQLTVGYNNNNLEQFDALNIEQ